MASGAQNAWVRRMFGEDLLPPDSIIEESPAKVAGAWQAPDGRRWDANGRPIEAAVAPTAGGNGAPARQDPGHPAPTDEIPAGSGQTAGEAPPGNYVSALDTGGAEPDGIPAGSGQTAGEAPPGNYVSALDTGGGEPEVGGEAQEGAARAAAVKTGPLDDEEIARYGAVAKLGKQVNEAVKAMKVRQAAIEKAQATYVAISRTTLGVLEREIAQPTANSPDLAVLNAVCDQLTLCVANGTAPPEGEPQGGQQPPSIAAALEAVGRAWTDYMAAYAGGPPVAALMRDIEALPEDLPRIKQFKAGALRALSTGRPIGLKEMESFGTAGDPVEGRARPSEDDWDDEAEQSAMVAEEAARELARVQEQTSEEEKAEMRTSYEESLDTASAEVLQSVIDGKDGIREQLGHYYADGGKAAGLDDWLNGLVKRAEELLPVRKEAEEREAAAVTPEQRAAAARAEAEELERSNREQVAAMRAQIKAERPVPPPGKDEAPGSITDGTGSRSSVSGLVARMVAFADEFDELTAQRDELIAEVRDGLRRGVLFARTETKVLEQRLAGESRSDQAATRRTLDVLTGFIQAATPLAVGRDGEAEQRQAAESLAELSILPETRDRLSTADRDAMQRARNLLGELLGQSRLTAAPLQRLAELVVNGDMLAPDYANELETSLKKAEDLTDPDLESVRRAALGALRWRIPEFRQVSAASIR